MRNLKELFVACGGDGNSEQAGDFVKLPDEMKPIDIVLKVVPTDINLINDLVTFVVLIPDHLEGGQSGMLRVTEYTVEVELPLHAIELANGAG